MNLHAMAQRIEHWLTEKLIPYARNPRTHSDAQIAQIAASIAEFGFNNPILVDTKAGIIAGHARLLAARKLQLKEVPVIVLDHLTEIQNRAYILADNQLALNAGWDEQLLRSELAAGLTDEDAERRQNKGPQPRYHICCCRGEQQKHEFHSKNSAVKGSYGCRHKPIVASASRASARRFHSRLSSNGSAARRQ